MYKAVVVTTLTLTALDCGPELGDEEDPPGTLEYEIPSARFYRLDRRLDIIGVDPMVDSSGCGLLTDRAYEDIVGTRETLDPSAAYDWSDCEYSPEGLMYLEGFAHSPFGCNWYCCHPDLAPIALAYFAAGSNLDGQYPNIDGERYVALEPDMPCPD